MKYYHLTSITDTIDGEYKMYVNNELFNFNEYFFDTEVLPSTRQELEETEHLLWCAKVEVECKKEGIDVIVKSPKYATTSTDIPVSVRESKVTKLQEEVERLKYLLNHLDELKEQRKPDPYTEIPYEVVTIVSSTKIYIVVDGLQDVSVTEIPVSDILI